MPRYDVFLSHASADKPAVEILARKLREAGHEPFLDKWHLIPGEPWQEALEEALDESRTCAVFLGKALGPWQNEEMRSALADRVRDRSIRVIPVLLPGGQEPGKEGLPRFLRRLTWVDVRAGLDNQDAFRRLLAGIRGETPGDDEGGLPHSSLDRGYRCMAPAREPFVQRSEYARVRDALVVQETGRGTTVGITTAIHGAGGFGKTALAVELCYDPMVRERYPDGVLWVQMRDNLNDDERLKEVRDVLRRRTNQEPPAFETFAKAGQHLVELLQGMRVLLVVDDAWHPGDVFPFHGLTPPAALLITTRDRRTLPRETVSIHVDAMGIPEAVQLLGAGLPEGEEEALKTLAARLGEWPLLLKLVNRQVEGWIAKGLGEAIRQAESALKAKGLTYFDPKDAKDRSQTAALTLEVSLERLSKEEQERFTQLAVFPEDVNVPLPVLGKLWQLDLFDTEELASRLHALSLLRDLDVRADTVRLHDVIRAYLLKKGESHLADWHRRLLDAYREGNDCWSDLPPHESYLWIHLPHHLIGAGQSDVCRELLLDFQYLDAKLRATDVNALLADYSFFADKDEELRLVRDALRLSAHVLARNPFQLREQLWGRLLDRREAGICDLVRASEESGTPWLRPRKASLSRPGGALIRTINHPGIPQVLAKLSDGRLVSGAFDGKLRVWDVESGQILQTLEGHSSGVDAVALLDSGRMVSGSEDGTLRVWDIESGKTLRTLKDHSGMINAMALLGNGRAVSGSAAGTLRVWDVESGEILRTLEGHPCTIQVMALLDSGRVVSGSDDGTLRVWDVESGTVSHTLEGQRGRISVVAVLDHRRVVSASDDGTLQIWDVESNETLLILDEFSDVVVFSIAVLDSRRVVAGCSDGTLRVWDMESGQILQTLNGHFNEVFAVTVLDGRSVVSGAYDETLRVWHVESSKAFQPPEEDSDCVESVAVLDSHRVVSGCSDGTLRVWDVDSCQTLQVLKGHYDRVRAVAVVGRRLEVSSSQDGRLQIWEVESGQMFLEGDSRWALAMTRLEGSRVVSGSDDGTLRVWDVESGQLLQTLEGHSDEVLAVAVIDSRRVVSSAFDGTLRVWDLESGQILQLLDGHADEVTTVTVLDRRHVISASSDGSLRIWDVDSGQVLLEESSTGVSAVTVLDRHRVVSGAFDGTLRVWDVENGQTLQTLTGHAKGVSVVALLEGRYVVSGSYDQTLRVWDVESGKVECSFTLDASVATIAVIPDRRIVVAGDATGRVHFFDFVEP